MLKIAICDDDKDFLRNFQGILQDAFNIQGVEIKLTVFTDAASLLKSVNCQEYDILCLDIEIGEENGAAVGRYIRDDLKDQHTQIVFISSYTAYHDDYLLYDATPMAFIRKPIRQEEVERFVAKAINRIIKPRLEAGYFTIISNRKTHDILKRDIIYIECDKRKKIVHATSGEFPFNSNMKNVIETIDSPNFIVIHKSYLVNMSYIQNLTKDFVICNTGHKVPVSETYFSHVRRTIAKTGMGW